jgi:hypothetical protein
VSVRAGSDVVPLERVTEAMETSLRAESGKVLVGG